MTTNARFAEFLIVMAVTDPDASPYLRMSMFIVPADTPGVEIVYGLTVPAVTHVARLWTSAGPVMTKSSVKNQIAACTAAASRVASTSGVPIVPGFGYALERIDTTSHG